jgi:hypothetical protein
MEVIDCCLTTCRYYGTSREEDYFKALEARSHLISSHLISSHLSSIQLMEEEEDNRFMVNAVNRSLDLVHVAIEYIFLRWPM